MTCTRPFQSGFTTLAFHPFFEPVQIIPPASGIESPKPLEREKDEASSLQQELLRARGKLQEQETRMAELENVTTSERAFLQQQNEALTHELNLMRRALDEEQKKSSSSSSSRW